MHYRGFAPIGVYVDFNLETSLIDQVSIPFIKNLTGRNHGSYALTCLQLGCHELETADAYRSGLLSAALGVREKILY